jgi:putative tricarboxylic transport membrane protein
MEASTFEVAFLTDPVGPKALPYLAAVVFLAAGARLVLRPDDAPSWPARAVGLRMVGAVGAFVVYALTLAPFGFWLSTTVVMGLLSGLFGGPARRGWAVGAVFAAALWVLFVNVLGLPLPVGALWTR